jgi:hypothetical protein
VSFTEVGVTSPEAWTEEGLKLCKDQVYNLKEGGKPDGAYLQAGQKLCRRRLALAGYRLADLLNAVLGKS